MEKSGALLVMVFVIELSSTLNNRKSCNSKIHLVYITTLLSNKFGINFNFILLISFIYIISVETKKVTMVITFLYFYFLNSTILYINTN